MAATAQQNRSFQHEYMYIPTIVDEQWQNRCIRVHCALLNQT